MLSRRRTLAVAAAACLLHVTLGSRGAGGEEWRKPGGRAALRRQPAPCCGGPSSQSKCCRACCRAPTLLTRVLWRARLPSLHCLAEELRVRSSGVRGRWVGGLGLASTACRLPPLRTGRGALAAHTLRSAAELEDEEPWCLQLSAAAWVAVNISALRYEAAVKAAMPVGGCPLPVAGRCLGAHMSR